MQGSIGIVALAALAGLGFTWLGRALAVRVGMVDRPDGRRKLQPQSIAVIGGVAVLAAVLVSLGIGALLFPEVTTALTIRPDRTGSLLAAVIVIALVGLADDRRGMRARHKLLGQLIAALILVGPGGFVIEQVSLVGWLVPLGIFAIPITLFWLLAAINALNLLDGMDGLLGVVGVIVTGSLAGMAFLAGHPFAGWIALAWTGALMGFLRFNWPPATVYLGDCGSMLIGLVVGALAIEASLKGPAVAIIAPTGLLILPILDTGAAIVRRQLTGRGLAVSDRGHLHHVLQRHGMTRVRVLVLLAALGTVAAGGALVSTFLQNDLLAALSALSVVLILLTTGLFGSAELRLIWERSTAAYRSALGARHPIELAVRLQGSGNWPAVWKRIVLATDDLGLVSARLDVNAPAWHEGFHGRWDRLDGESEADGLWRLDLPVHGHGQVIGRLSLAGTRGSESLADLLMALTQLVAATEADSDLALPTIPTLPRVPTTLSA